MCKNRYSVLFVVASYFLGVNAILAQAPWPTFQYDMRRSGQSPNKGHSLPELTWTYATGGRIVSSAVIDENNTVYIRFRR
ncbi:MAG: hypothetical protein AB1349_11865 [Elusimicrobiota bacterium]